MKELERYVDFLDQLRQEAMRDSGHLISLALGILLSIRTGRAAMTVEGTLWCR